MADRSLKSVFVAAVLTFASLAVVTVSLAVVASFVSPICHLGDHRTEFTSFRIKAIGEVFNEFARSEGYYPEPREAFALLVRRGFLDKMPADAWGNEYRYSIDETSFTVVSYGADGREGGLDAAVDIVRTFPKIRRLAGDSHGWTKG